MATPLNAANAFIDGYNQPAQGMNPADYHELMQSYVALLKEIEVAETQLQSDVVTSYGTMYTSLISARANVLGALAEGAKASAMSKQAQADYLKNIYGPMNEAATQLILLQPPQGSMDLVSTASNNAVNAALAELARTEGEALAQKTGAVEGMPFMAEGGVSVYGLLSEQLDNSGFKQVANDAVAGLNTGTDWTQTQRMSYGKNAADQYVGSTYQVMSAAVVSINEKRMASGLPPLQVSDEDLWRGAHEYTADGVAKIQSQAGFNNPAAVQAFEAEQERAAAVYSQAASHIDGLDDVGLPPDLVRATKQSMSDMEGLISGGPELYAQRVADMPVGDELTLGKQLILTEINGLKNAANPDDPLTKSVNQMRSIPGFDTWAHTMGFNSTLRAAIYAGNHPYEAKKGMDLIAQGVTEPYDLRRAMRAEGVHVTPVGRALAPFVGRRMNFITKTALLGQTLREKLEGAEPSNQVFTPAFMKRNQEDGLVDGVSEVDLIEASAQRGSEGGVPAGLLDEEAGQAEPAIDDVELKSGPIEVIPPAPKAPLPPAVAMDGAEVGRGRYRDMSTPDGMTFREYEDGTVQVVDGRGLLEDGVLLDSDNMEARALVNEAQLGVATSTGAEGGDQVQGDKATVSPWKAPVLDLGTENIQTKSQEAATAARAEKVEQKALPAESEEELSDLAKMASRDQSGAAKGYSDRVRGWQK